MENINDNSQISVLIAEDDPHIALAIHAIIKKAFDCQLISIAEDGEKAWSLIQKNTYSVVISDWNMPGLTGHELLNLIRTDSQHNSIPFLMLTARADKGSVISAIQSGANDYISKPYEKYQLIQKVEKLVQFSKDRKDNLHELEKTQSEKNVPDDIIKYILDRFKEGKVELPLLPHVYTAVNEAIENEDYSIQDIVKIIETEPAISAPLITISNSSFYRGKSEYKTLEQAITRIGLNATKQYIFMIEGRYLFKSENPKYSDLMHLLWVHSIATAVCSRRISEYIKKGEMDVLFSMGLMHDIGKLPIFNILIDLSEKGENIDQNTIYDVFDQLHTQIGVIMLSQWHFPNEIINIVKYHHQLDNKAHRTVELFIVHLANHMVRDMGFSLKSGDDAELSAVESAKLLKLDEVSLDRIKLIAMEDIEDIIGKI